MSALSGRLVKPAAFVVLFTAAAALLTGLASPGHEVLGGSYGAACGLLTGLAMLGYRFLARRLGRLTAVAAMSCLGAVLFGGVALVLSDCPGADITGGRCTSYEVGTWLLVGALLPMVWAAVILPPAALGRGVRALWRLRRRRRDDALTRVETVREERAKGSAERDVRRRTRKAQRRARRLQRS